MGYKSFGIIFEDIALDNTKSETINFYNAYCITGEILV